MSQFLRSKIGISGARTCELTEGGSIASGRILTVPFPLIILRCTGWGGLFTVGVSSSAILTTTRARLRFFGGRQRQSRIYLWATVMRSLESCLESLP